MSNHVNGGVHENCFIIFLLKCGTFSLSDVALLAVSLVKRQLVSRIVSYRIVTPLSLSTSAGGFGLVLSPPIVITLLSFPIVLFL